MWIVFEVTDQRLAVYTVCRSQDIHLADIINIRDYRVDTGSLLDPFHHFLRVLRAQYDMPVKRPHRAGKVINLGQLSAGNPVKITPASYQTAKACSCHSQQEACCANLLHRYLDGRRSREAAFFAGKMTCLL